MVYDPRNAHGVPWERAPNQNGKESSSFRGKYSGCDAKKEQAINDVEAERRPVERAGIQAEKSVVQQVYKGLRQAKIDLRPCGHPEAIRHSS